MSGARHHKPHHKPSTHKGEGPWTKGYDHRMGERCSATTIREPDDPRWSPDQPDTYVRAECVGAKSHRGWHVTTDGYAWHPDDDAQYVVLPTT